MKTIGAFEAKTRFSELLRNVENGDAYQIKRRGKVIAKLTSSLAGHGDNEVQNALDYFCDIRKHAHADADEIASWRREGRR